MAAPENIIRLVDAFESNCDTYKSLSYNEEDIKIDFINPLFEALGWDVGNKTNKPPELREVKFEDSVEVQGRIKNPDYSFRIERERKFFVEAKKPAVNIEDGISPAFQLRSYAWSASLPLSIVTDFEEFAIYDCRNEPSKLDKPSKSRLLIIKYYEFEKRWDEIASIFSKESVQNGSLDKYIESIPAKRGSKKVDEALLEDISEWREALAVNIAEMNPSLDQKSLNHAVQMTIDRILFLRICEDRSIEDYGRLKKLLDGENVYQRLFELFDEADKRYNSGLFHFHAEEERNNFDTITPSIKIEDRVLQDIIRGLYFPDCPYVFSEIPAEILGRVYEQFLGKVIQLDESHEVKVVYKPEVRKAGGVYYTPLYIVDYIVKNTVGKLLENKSPQEASELRILDPACGSGSFLIGAYQYLLDWHLTWYKSNLVPLLNAGQKLTSNEVQGLLPAAIEKPGKNARARSKRIWERATVATLPIEQRAEEWHLRTAERKRILLNNIYGVDIDTQAVEVTKLSLLLKVLEGENKSTIADLSRYSDERALPDLGNNIKCGNSLIGWDILQGKPDLTQEELRRSNPFSWEDEFREVFAQGGFDVVIGNPPYIRIQTMKEWAPMEVEWYKLKYSSASKGNYDIYVVFVEQGLSLLNSQGKLGFILPHKFFNAEYGQSLRQVIADGGHLSKIVHFGDQQIFVGATTYTCLLFLDKSRLSEFEFLKVEDLRGSLNNSKIINKKISSNQVTPSEWIFSISKGEKLFQRLSCMPMKLGNITSRMAQGIRTSANEIYVLDIVSYNSDLITAYSKQLDRNVLIERGIISLFLRGREIKPYRISPSGKIVIIPYTLKDNETKLIPEEEMRSQFPNTFAYLQENKEYLENREGGRMHGPSWYAYIYPKNLEVMKTSKILIPDIANTASFALDNIGEYAFTSGYGITIKANMHESQKYILGLLNSNVLDFYLKHVSTVIRGGFFRYFTKFLSQLPIRTINFSEPQDIAQHDLMVSLVEKMLDLHKHLASSMTEHEKTMLSRQIQATDDQIDSLVYELYGLTDEEIEIVKKCA